MPGKTSSYRAIFVEIQPNHFYLNTGEGGLQAPIPPTTHSLNHLVVAQVAGFVDAREFYSSALTVSWFLSFQVYLF